MARSLRPLRRLHRHPEPPAQGTTHPTRRCRPAAGGRTLAAGSAPAQEGNLKLKLTFGNRSLTKVPPRCRHRCRCCRRRRWSGCGRGARGRSRGAAAAGETVLYTRWCYIHRHNSCRDSDSGHCRQRGVNPAPPLSAASRRAVAHARARGCDLRKQGNAAVVKRAPTALPLPQRRQTPSVSAITDLRHGRGNNTRQLHGRANRSGQDFQLQNLVRKRA